MNSCMEMFASWLRAHCSTERGASLVEYALLMAFIAVVCVAAVAFLGQSTSHDINSGASALN